MPYRRTGRPPGRPRHPGLLTPAELRVLEGVRQERTYASIAADLGLSPETVHSHISSMLTKLNLHDRRALAAWQPPSEAEPVGHCRWWGLAALVRRVSHPGILGGALLGCVALIVAGFLGWYLVRANSSEDEPSTTATPEQAVVVPPPLVTATRSPATSPSPAAPTATPTASATPALPPIPDPIVGYPRGTRTGDPDIDRVLAAIETGDVDALVSMVGFLRAPCVAGEGTDPHDGPVCRQEEVVGTPAEYFLATACAPFGYFRRDETEKIREVLSEFAGGGLLLFAVFDQDAPAATEMVFAPAASDDLSAMAGSSLWVTALGIGGARVGCSEGPGDRLMRETAAGAPILLQPPVGALAGRVILDEPGAGSVADAAPAPDGGLYFVGAWAQPGERVGDANLVRVKPDGTTAWRGSLDGLPVALAVAHSGNIVTAVTSISAGVPDGVLRNRWFSPDGSTLDEFAIPFRAWRLAVPGSEDAVVVLGGAGGQIEAARIDGSGVRQWHSSFGGVGLDTPADISAYGGTVYVLASYETSSPLPGSDPFPEREIWLLKLNLDGELLWERRIDLPNHQTAGGVAALVDGGAVVVGTTGGFSDDGNVPRQDGLLLARFSREGEVVWQTEYDTAGDNEGVDVAVTASGDIVVAGVILDTSDGDRFNQLPDSRADRLLLARFKGDGELEWVQAWPLTEGLAWDPSLALGDDGTAWIAVTVGVQPFDKATATPDVGLYRFFVGE